MKYPYIYDYEFYCGTSAAETAHRINDVYGAGVSKESTIRFSFQRFRSGNFDLQNQPRGRPETKVENEELKAIVVADPSLSTSEIAAGYGAVGQKTLNLATYNGRTLRLDSHLAQLEEELRHIRWHVLGLSEVRRAGEDTLTLESGHLAGWSGLDESDRKSGAVACIRRDLCPAVDEHGSMMLMMKKTYTMGTL
ncbi:hypothetical protein evm_005776 [Chilo suppressalis]|nr:hypothetical protein evm_005776 [Chilo suppressalis]